MRRIPVVGVSPSEFPGIVRDVGLGRTWEELLGEACLSGFFMYIGFAICRALLGKPSH